MTTFTVYTEAAKNSERVKHTSKKSLEVAIQRAILYARNMYSLTGYQRVYYIPSGKRDRVYVEYIA